LLFGARARGRSKSLSLTRIAGVQSRASLAISEARRAKGCGFVEEVAIEAIRAEEILGGIVGASAAMLRALGAVLVDAVVE
jgi:hypothetical protein